MAKVVRVKNVDIGHGRPKVCALVLGQNEEEIFELAKQSNTAECDLVEFRADHYTPMTDIEQAGSFMHRLRSIIKKPLIFTFRRKEEGGKSLISTEDYKKLLLMVAENGYAEIIDVEDSAAGNDREFIDRLKDYGAYIILSRHDFSGTPSQEILVQTFVEMQKKGADIIKVSYMPNSKKDVLNLINAAAEITESRSSCPIVAISMGHLGLITRIMGEFMESAITFASIGRTSAPGQINIDKMQQVLDILHENFKKVFLIGFMGTGKTAVANALNSIYGLKKIDLDAYIESKEHMSISDIFVSYSESYFRDKETKYLRHVLKENCQVISLGGGVLLRQENIDMIKKKGVIVLLTASPETIATRIANDRTRPLLGENMDLDYIKSLIDTRKKAYMEMADVVIDTDNRAIDEICKEIVETLGFNS